MDIIISNANNIPIYEQIYKQIKNNIISSKLPEGEALPSIRALAKELRVSVITTKRAYDELEKDGYINTVPGKGSYVAKKNLAIIKEDNLKKIENHMQQIIELSLQCGLSDEEVILMFKVMQEECKL